MTVLAQHLDAPDDRHRLVLLDTQRLRCLDCQRTMLLPSGLATTSTSRSAPSRLTDPDCPVHGRYVTACNGCAADAKADDHRTVVHQPTADVAARAAEVRAALPPPHPAFNRSRTFDSERMAAARAELDALRPQPETPETEPDQAQP